MNLSKPILWSLLTCISISINVTTTNAKVFESFNDQIFSLKDGLLDRNKKEKIEALWKVNELEKLFDYVEGELPTSKKQRSVLRLYEADTVNKVSSALDAITSENFEFFNNIINIKELMQLRISSSNMIAQSYNKESVSFTFHNSEISNKIRYVSLFNEKCEQTDLNHYKCQWLPLEQTARNELIPLTIGLQLNLSFFDSVLSKLLGGNESIYKYDYPLFALSNSIGTLALEGLIENTTIVEQNHSFTVNHRNRSCQQVVDREFEFKIPSNERLVDTPKFINSSYSRYASLRNIEVKNNRIIASFRVRNKGNCLNELGGLLGGVKINSDVAGILNGRIEVNTERTLKADKKVNIYEHMVEWGQKVQLNDIKNLKAITGELTLSEKTKVPFTSKNYPNEVFHISNDRIVFKAINEYYSEFNLLLD